MEVLETIIVDMSKKIVKLEAELDDLKNVQNKSEAATEENSSVKEANQSDPTDESFESKSHQIEA